MQEKPTKSREISERLRQEILGGKFDAARKLPSEHQLMRRFSVARETVRAALKELIDKKLVERRHGYGTFLADLAKTKAAQKFAMIVPDAYYPFYQRICRGISDAAKARGWSILSAALGSGSMRDRALRAVEFSAYAKRFRAYSSSRSSSCVTARRSTAASSSCSRTQRYRSSSSTATSSRRRFEANTTWSALTIPASATCSQSMS